LVSGACFIMAANRGGTAIDRIGELQTAAMRPSGIGFGPEADNS
jgi:hypothetical protein